MDYVIDGHVTIYPYSDYSSAFIYVCTEHLYPHEMTQFLDQLNNQQIFERETVSCSINSILPTSASWHYQYSVVQNVPALGPNTEVFWEVYKQLNRTPDVIYTSTWKMLFLRTRYRLVLFIFLCPPTFHRNEKVRFWYNLAVSVFCVCVCVCSSVSGFEPSYWLLRNFV
jgi:hypothetical protein